MSAGEKSPVPGNGWGKAEALERAHKNAARTVRFSTDKRLAKKRVQPSLAKISIGNKEEK